MTIMTGKQLALKCVDIAENYRTVYLYGAPGMPVTEATITQMSAPVIKCIKTPKKKCRNAPVRKKIC